MIEVSGLTKRYSGSLALDALTFSAEPGLVTGFLGPNGAGKTTAMRLMLGIDRPDAGVALFNGVPYVELRQPLRVVGAVLDARYAHAGRSAFNHLLSIARTHGLGRQRVQDVLDLTGMSSVAHRSPGEYSLGMSQRLGLAGALLGDPEVLLLDEPMNGLDAEGMSWIRRLLPQLAAEGRTILVSSHLMSEMAQIADRLVVIGRGRLVAETTVSEFVQRAGGTRNRIRSADTDRLMALLGQHAASVDQDVETRSLIATGMTPDEIGALAAANGIVIYELAEERPSLEEVFLQMTSDEVQFAGRT